MGFNNLSTVLIINTKSRKGRNLFFKSVDLLKEKGIEIDTVYSIFKPQTLDLKLKEIKEKNFERVIIGGGDGTISSIIGNFINSDSIIGILPLGTSNSFTKSLKIPSDIESAVDTIVKGNISTIDLGKINDKYFANTVTIGYSSRIARSINNKYKKYFGVFGYIIQGLIIFFDHKAFEIDIKTKTKNYSFKALEIIIANGPFIGGFDFIPGAEVNNHKITIMSFQSTNKFILLKIWFLSFFKKHSQLKEVIEIFTDDAVIETKPKKYVDMDGEIICKTPINIQIIPSALKIYTPKI